MLTSRPNLQNIYAREVTNNALRGAGDARASGQPKFFPIVEEPTCCVMNDDSVIIDFEKMITKDIRQIVRNNNNIEKKLITTLIDQLNNILSCTVNNNKITIKLEKSHNVNEVYKKIRDAAFAIKATTSHSANVFAPVTEENLLNTLVQTALLTLSADIFKLPSIEVQKKQKRMSAISLGK